MGAAALALFAVFLFTWMPGGPKETPVALAVTFPRHIQSPTALYRAGGPVEVLPTVRGERIYFCARDGIVLSLQVMDPPGEKSLEDPLKLLCEVELGEFGDLLSRPAVAENRIFLANVRGLVFALSTEGEVLWKKKLSRVERINPFYP